MTRWQAVLDRQCGVASKKQLLRAGLSRHAFAWKIDSGRWQRPLPGIVVSHSGSLERGQLEWAALLWSGRDAALAGPTAAARDGLKGYEANAIHVVIPADRRVRPATIGATPMVIVRTGLLGAKHIHPIASPRRTRIARSLVDLAASRPRPEDAFAVLAAGVQQRLVNPAALQSVMEDFVHLRHKREMRDGLTDLVGGVQSLPEREFLRVVRRAGLPVPDSQTVRTYQGKRRYLDFYWEAFRLAVEIDGLSHLSVDRWLEDTARSNDVVVGGDAVLRFPAVLIRTRPDLVVDVLTRAFAGRGWSTLDGISSRLQPVKTSGTSQGQGLSQMKIAVPGRCRPRSGDH